MTAKRHSVAAADPLRSGTSPAPVDRLPVADRDLWQNRVYVDVDAFARNVRAIRAHVGRHRELLAVVKDDAYGHGAAELSRVAVVEGADVLGVVNVDEARALRVAGITSAILVLGLTAPAGAAEIPRWGAGTVLCQLEFAEALEVGAREARQRVPVYVKVDTGMGRLGIAARDVPRFCDRLRDFPHLSLQGLITHLPDVEDKDFSGGQIEVFNKLIGEVQRRGHAVPRNHLANSAAILDLPDAYFNMVRAGIILYGLYPSEGVARSVPLEPVMTYRTPVIFSKEVRPGETISYKRMYEAKEKSTVATTPLGYRHGYPRLLSNRGEGLWRGRRVPVAGAVCMDMTMFDLGPSARPRLGEEITVLGRDGDEEITADELAAHAETISYELITSLGMRSRRYYLRGGLLYPEPRERRALSGQYY
ncbi:MAG: alanine racemase [bacterium]